MPDTELRETAFAPAVSLAEGPLIALAYMKDNLDHALRWAFWSQWIRKPKTWFDPLGQAITKKRCVRSSTNANLYSAACPTRRRTAHECGVSPETSL